MATDTSAIEVKERELFSGLVSTPGETAGSHLVPQQFPARLPKATVAQIAISGARQIIAYATSEYERGVTALLVPIAMGGGAFVYFALPNEPSLIWLVIWTSLLGVGGVGARSAPLLKLLLFGAALTSGGATLAKLEVLRADTKVIGGEISTRLTGCIVNIDYLANGRVRVLIDVVRTERPALRYQPGRVSVSANRLPAGAVAGALISGPVRLLPPPGPVRPGGYDYSFQSYFRGIGANGFFLGSPLILDAPLDQSIQRRFLAFADNARNTIAARIRQCIGGAEGEIAAALIVGVRAGIPEHVNESLRRTGLAHILSISGLHMALVAAIVMGAIRFGFALFPRIASLYPAKKFAAAGALSVVGAYLVISGGDVAAQRSFIMLAVMLLAVLMDRRALSMRNLATAAVVVLVATPHEIVGPSFQMSFAATAALIGAYAIWLSLRGGNGSSGLHSTQMSLIQRTAKGAASLLAGTIMTAIVAGLASAIFGAWHFQRVSPLSLFANLAVSPIVSLIVMPFAVLSAVAMPLGLDAPFLFVTGKGLSAMLQISDWLSARSPLDTVGLVPGSAVIWFTAALGFATLATTKLRLAALVCAVGGVLSLRGVTTPDVFVSEDARLVAVSDGEGKLLLNRYQPNSFTLDGWKRALNIDEVVAPIRAGRVRNALGDGSTAPRGQRNPSSSAIEKLLADVSLRHFTCNDSLCLVEHGSGLIIAVLQASYVPRELCAVADIIVNQAPKSDTNCRNGQAKIIDARSLARRGAAAVSIFQSSGQQSPAGTIEYAIGERYRPWHSHRAFSRTARGKEPYIRKERPYPHSNSEEQLQIREGQ